MRDIAPAAVGGTKSLDETNDDAALTTGESCTLHRPQEVSDKAPTQIGVALKAVV